MSTAERFAATIACKPPEGEGLQLFGSFEFARHDTVDETGLRHRGRHFLVGSVAVLDGTGRRYWLTGSHTHIESRVDWPDRFLLVHQGMLVGAGPLNNRFLDLVLRFTEFDAGRAAVEIVELCMNEG